MRHDKYEYHRFTSTDHTLPYHSSERRKKSPEPGIVIGSPLIIGAIIALAAFIFIW